MSAKTSDRKRSEGEVVGVLTAMLGALIVVLLIAVNVQLVGAGLGEGGGGSGGPEASTIPPPVQGTSNDVLSEELQQLSTSLAQPVNLLQEQLAPLGGFTSGQAALSGSFENVASSVNKLSSVRLQLRKMSQGLSATTSSLGGLNRGIDATSRSTQGMEETMQGMKETMQRVNRSINATGKSTGESIAKMGTGIEAMQQSLGTMNQSLGAMNQSLAATSGGTQEMRESLVKLNANMERFLKLFCTVLTSDTECTAESE